MKRLVREFQTSLPHFNGHMEALEWFREKFNDNFQFKGSRNIDGEKIYLYHLFTDRNPYIKGMRDLDKKSLVDGLELSVSYHIVIILEYGRTHIIY